jgi:hypothetical protein
MAAAFGYDAFIRQRIADGSLYQKDAALLLCIAALNRRLPTIELLLASGISQKLEVSYKVIPEYCTFVLTDIVLPLDPP